ncbi:MAG: carbonic anhydrase [Planctomycetia bacterium]
MCKTHDLDSTTPALSRRRLLTAAAGLLAAPSLPSLAAAKQPDDIAAADPKETLKLLYAGNERFVKGLVKAPNRDIERVREVAPRQKPFAAFLGCADSRVPVEIVFDQGFGDLFVTRIAGNVTTPECIGSLEFGTLVLGAKVLYVLGHTNCGAVAAAVKGEAVPGQISSLFQHLRPAVRAAKGDVAAAIKENVRTQAAILSEASPVIAQLVREGKLTVAGGVYDLATGKVTPVEMRDP